MVGYSQDPKAQWGLRAEPPLYEGEMLKVFDGKIHRQNEQGTWYVYTPANFRPWLR